MSALAPAARAFRLERFLRLIPLVFVWTAFASLICISAARADERILSYDSVITVQADGSLNVRETLHVRAEGNQIRRGIYRDFPTLYPGRNGEHFDVGFDFRSAQRDGSPEPWHSETHGNGVRIYLGSKDVMLPPGEHTYELEYRADHELGFFADHDELYWNVTGNGWDFPIDSATARVLLPEGVPESEVNLEAYTGPQGAKGTNYSARMDHGVPFFATTGGLGGHEGLTIVVTWPKGFITPSVERASSASAFSTFLQNHGMGADGVWVLRDARPAVFGIGGLALLLIYYLWIWNRVGRDPPGLIIIPEYAPPPNISPGGMRFLTRMRYDDRCFAADVLNLAVKGHLIVEEASLGFLGKTKKFTLVKQQSPTAKPLSAEEQTLHARIFASGPRVTLDNENYKAVQPVKWFHGRTLKARFMPSVFRINGGWHALGILGSIAIIVALVMCVDRYVVPPWYFVTPLGLATSASVVVAFAANGVFGKLLKAPTAAGQAMLDHVRGFKMYLEVAEGEDLKHVTTPPPPLTPDLFHAFLPAALALGVEQRWSERFAQVFADHPEAANPAWYSGSSWGFEPRRCVFFESQLAVQSAISSASTAPGSSSGSSGGGSSGGGGGGGGGGGW